AWWAAFALRFHSPWVLSYLPVTKGVPEVGRYLLLLPVIVLLWPLLLYFHGLYTLKRGRSRIDELFAILFSVIIGSAIVLGLTLYARVYYFYQPDVAPQWEYSQAVFALFVGLDILALNLGRWAIRGQLQRAWRAGHNVERVLVAGAGDLGRTVAETLAAHRELGYEVVGFVDDGAAVGHTIAGLPVLGKLDATIEVTSHHRVDQVYIALPLEQHADVLRIIKCVSNECVDVK